MAVAGLVSAPAFAQSNVTVYGVADAYMGFGSHGDNDKAAINSGGLSGSRLGFRGVEDLGNGLKGVFTVEQGFDISDGTGMGNASRQAFVGLGGSFGTVSLGRQYAPGYDFQYDVTASAPIGPQSILSNQSGMTITPNSGARWDNSVAYNGSFSGLKVRAIYGMGNNEDSYEVPTLTGTKLMDPSDDDRFGLGVEYANGPLKVGAVYHYLTDPAEIAGASDDQQEWLVGGSYDFGVLTLAGSYQEVEGLGNLKGADADLWQIGVLVPVGAAGNVHLAYGEVDFDINAMGVNESAKAKSYTLAYTHALSKRTTAYAGWNRTDNDNGLDLGLVDYIQPAGATTYGGDESDLFFVGMRHTF
ncbi:porin [Thauera sp.]|uniref:porin n=1 Tax=Thauera sp. TaxID=1905334 RepID=UPI00257FC055|nr:porin [Thauera sp.]